MIKAGVLGATGYAGLELVRLLSQHPNAEIAFLGSQSYKGQRFSDVYKSLSGIVDVECEEIDVAAVKDSCDIAFTALPHGASQDMVSELVQAGVTVIDLSGDFRYNDPEVYTKWYGLEHKNHALLRQAVYGLPELHRSEIAGSRLVANPGCYTTCSILGMAPLLSKGLIHTKGIVIDAKSGVTGAGRGMSLASHYCECTQTMKAYGVTTHRHTSEIEQELSLIAGEDIVLSFTPHLIPVKRGILATIYADLASEKSAEELLEVYRSFYKDEFFVRIRDCGTLPELRDVATSNFVDIGLTVDKRLNRVIVISCIDNLMKGAAGQAVQNMNILFGLKETAGLDSPPLYL